MPEDKNTAGNKRIAKNTLVLYVRMLFVMCVSLYTSRVVLAELGVTDYGIYNVVGSVVTIFTFISEALGNATQRFIVFSIGKGDIGHTGQTYNTCMVVHLAMAFVVVLLIETIGLWFLNGELNIPAERYRAAFYTFHISVAVCFLSIVRTPWRAEIIAHEHMGVYATISIVETVLKLLIAVALSYFSSDKLIVYATLLFIVQILVNLFYHLYCRLKYEECVLALKKINNKQLYSEIGSFAGWSMFGNITWLAYTQGINLMLNIFFGPVVNAARGVAVQVEAAVTSFVKSFQTALNPQITKSYAQNDMPRMHELMIYSSKFSFFLYILFAIPIFFEANNLMNIWLIEVPEHTVNFVRLTLIILLVNPISNPLGVSNDSTGHIKWFQITCSLISLQIITLSYLFLHLGYEPEIVFVINFLVMSVQTFAKLLFAKKQVGLQLRVYLHAVIFPISLVLLVSLATSYLLFQWFTNELPNVVLYLICSASVVIFISFLLGFNHDEKKRTIALIRKKTSDLPMKKIPLFWWHWDLNFGDCASPYIVQKLCGCDIHNQGFPLKRSLKHFIKTLFLKRKIDFSEITESIRNRKHFIVGLGSIIDNSNKNAFVWGSGFQHPEKQFRGGVIKAVRGKYTAKELVERGFPYCPVHCDPGLLLPLIYQPMVKKQFLCGIIPHFREADDVKTLIGDRSDMLLIDLRTDKVEKIIDEILSCKYILSSSLHGLIVAHAYQIPALFFQYTHHGEGLFKYNDYFSSVDIPIYKPTQWDKQTKLSADSIESMFTENRDRSIIHTNILEMQKSLLSVFPYRLSRDYCEDINSTLAHETEYLSKLSMSDTM